MKLKAERGAIREYVDVESGTRFFSVSQIRKVMFDSGIPESTLEPARLRGIKLHYFFAMLLGSRLDLCPTPVPVLGYEGYCLAIENWVERNRVIPKRIEDPGVCLKHGFAGTVDAQALYGPRGVLAIIDLKTGTATNTDNAQLLLYKMMEEYADSRLLIDLYAHEDGTYKEVQHGPDPITGAAALSALGILRWRASL